MARTELKNREMSECEYLLFNRLLNYGFLEKVFFNKSFLFQGAYNKMFEPYKSPYKSQS